MQSFYFKDIKIEKVLIRLQRNNLATFYNFQLKRLKSYFLSNLHLVLKNIIRNLYEILIIRLINKQRKIKLKKFEL